MHGGDFTESMETGLIGQCASQIEIVNMWEAGGVAGMQGVADQEPGEFVPAAVLMAPVITDRAQRIAVLVCSRTDAAFEPLAGELLQDICSQLASVFTKLQVAAACPCCCLPLLLPAPAAACRLLPAGFCLPAAPLPRNGMIRYAVRATKAPRHGRADPSCCVAHGVVGRSKFLVRRAAVGHFGLAPAALFPNGAGLRSQESASSSRADGSEGAARQDAGHDVRVGRFGLANRVERPGRKAGWAEDLGI